jgi:predicted transcriptional regulator
MKAKPNWRATGIYGSRGRVAADPTPEEIRQRCAEVHEIRRIRALGLHERQDAMQRMVIAAIQTSGPTTMTAMRQRLNLASSTMGRLADAMVSQGLIIHVIKGARSLYSLPDDAGPAEPGLVSNDELYRRVTGRKFRPARAA